MQPSTDAELNAVLAEFVKSIQAILGEKFLTAYLQGSFALGDWDKDSDVDFMIVIEDDLNDSEVQALNAMHARLFEIDSYWPKHLEGSYFPKELLKPEYANKNELWYADNGAIKLHRDVHDNTLVVRWVTYEYGITLAGLDAKTLLAAVDADDLRREVQDVIHDWGNEILSGSYQLDNAWAQPHVVLGYCRMLHTLATGRIHSKPVSAEWAKVHLDSKWIALIERARERRLNQFSHVHEKADPADFLSTQEFIRYAMTNASSFS
jgi:predicted nucleotidyltransferase